MSKSEQLELTRHFATQNASACGGQTLPHGYYLLPLYHALPKNAKNI